MIIIQPIRDGMDPKIRRVDLGPNRWTILPTGMEKSIAPMGKQAMVQLAWPAPTFFSRDKPANELHAMAHPFNTPFRQTIREISKVSQQKH